MDRVGSSFRAVFTLPSLSQLDRTDLLPREAACRQHANENNDAMNAFHNAAKSYKKSDPEGQSSPSRLHLMRCNDEKRLT